MPPPTEQRHFGLVQTAVPSSTSIGGGLWEIGMSLKLLKSLSNIKNVEGFALYGVNGVLELTHQT